MLYLTKHLHTRISCKIYEGIFTNPCFEYGDFISFSHSNMLHHWDSGDAFKMCRHHVRALKLSARSRNTSRSLSRLPCWLQYHRPSQCDQRYQKTARAKVRSSWLPSFANTIVAGPAEYNRYCRVCFLLLVGSEHCLLLPINLANKSWSMQKTDCDIEIVEVWREVRRSEYTFFCGMTVLCDTSRSLYSPLRNCEKKFVPCSFVTVCTILRRNRFYRTPHTSHLHTCRASCIAKSGSFYFKSKIMPPCDQPPTYLALSRSLFIQIFYTTLLSAFYCIQIKGRMG